MTRTFALPLSALAIGLASLAAPAAASSQAPPRGVEVRTCDLDDRQCLQSAAANGELVSFGGGSAGGGSTPTTYRDVTFGDGDVAFADQVISFTSGGPSASASHTNPRKALGTPDWSGGSRCSSVQSCTFVSLGSGGQLAVRFTDNVLIGGGTPDVDLWVFEVGPQVEDMFVEVSADGSNWTSVGSIGGGKSGVDLDAYGFGPDASLSFVRLTDDPDKDGKSGSTVGADVDAIGAVNATSRSKPRCYCQ